MANNSVLNEDDIARYITKADKTGQTVSVETTVTPAIAGYILKKYNTENRRLRDPAVKRYAETMQAGEWVVSNPIMFNDRGLLEDGQHRLSAVVLANKSIRTILVFGVQKNFDLDKPVVRDIADTARIINHRDYDKTFMSGINNIFRITKSRSNNPRSIECIKMYDNLRDYIDPLVENIPRQENRIILNAALAAALICIAANNVAEIEDIISMTTAYRTNNIDTFLSPLRDSYLSRKGAFDRNKSGSPVIRMESATKEYIKYFVPYLCNKKRKLNDTQAKAYISKTYEIATR